MHLSFVPFFVLCFIFARELDAQSVPLLSRECTPLSLVEKFKDFNHHCTYLTSENEDSAIASFYAALPEVTIGRTFPLRGCVAGCLNGEDWKKYFSARVGHGNGWGGFCFEESPAGIQLTSSIADQLTTKPIVVDESWSSVVYDVGRGSGVWAVNYESDGPILADYEIHRMEMKQSAKGALTVKVYIKRVDSSNDGPFSVFHYNLLQICSRDGDYLDRPVTQLPGKDGLI